MADATITPYSTVMPFAGDKPVWLNEMDGERLAAYTAYETMYWSNEDCIALIRRNDDGAPLYIPKPKMIVDTTAHYLLKGMHVGVVDVKTNAELVLAIDNFCKRERFYSRFQVAKLAGVCRGDWVFHMTADPNKEEGSRISLNSVDPATYFPEFDTDDLEKRTGAMLVEQSVHPDDPNKVALKVLRYWKEYDPETGAPLSPLVWREENLWEVEGWQDEKKAKKLKTLIPAGTLPTDITTIPLYHFRNAEWDGYEFGNSELKGYERLFQAIDQAVSDEEISLALVGLGVYATDAGRPKDKNGKDTDWIVSPGEVWEMPGATMVKRLEGITTVQPVLDHVGYLEDNLPQTHETLAKVDVNTAESGIALALKFMPTLAKIEYRDTAGVEILTQMWYDWKFWWKAYESQDFTLIDIVITLGEKMPLNRPKVIEELNNLLDRHIISKQFYRDQLTKMLGYEFPEGIAQEILDEIMAEAEARIVVNPTGGAEGNTGDGSKQIGPGGRKVGAGDTKDPKDQSTSNNKTRVNESNGTEVKK